MSEPKSVSLKFQTIKPLLLAAGAAVVGIVVLSLSVPRLWAQSSQGSAARPEFEVASIKSLAPPYLSGGGGGGGPWIADHGRFRAPTAQVRYLIGWAYGMSSVQVHGGPAWLNELYEFDAEACCDAGPAQIRAMVQTLLSDRFKLAVHRETQEGQVAVLVVGKNGSKLQEVQEQSKSYTRGYSTPGQQRWEFTEVGMVSLIELLSTRLEMPVLDETGLKGFYNFKVEFADPRRAQPSPDSLPDIFTAVKEELGLELKTQKAPVEILVIDHIERPTEN